MFLCFFLVLFWSLLLGCGEEEELLVPLSETTADLDWPRDQEKLTKPGSQPPNCTPARNKSYCEEQLDSDSEYGIQCVGTKIFLTPCYCLTHDSKIGHCQFTCFRKSFLIADDKSSLINKQCSPFNRKGDFCSECENGTVQPAYSFSLKCVECNSSWKNGVMYVAVAYGPLAVFVGILVVFRVSVNTVPLLGFILVAQTGSFPFQMRIAVGMMEANHTSPYQNIGLYILSSAYGIWNLDFFRTIIPPFCISSDWSIVEIMCLDYIIATYPSVFILLTYTIVEFYSRGYRVFCWWRPFHWCLSRLKNGMNIKVPLVDAFGTFFSLSYAKILSTSFDILSFTQVWDQHGHTKRHAQYYGASERKKEILALALIMFIVFNALPIFVLFVFSMRPAPIRGNLPDVNGFFRPLLNTLLAPYKDGRDGTCNFRYFSVVYLMVRILLVVALLVCPTIFFQLVAAIVFLIVGMLVAVLRPYKSEIYNTIDTVLMLSLSVAYMGILSYFYAHFISPPSTTTALIFASIACNVPLLYFCLLIAYYAIMVRRLPQKLLRKLSNVMSGIKAFLLLWMQTHTRRSPRHERHASVSSRGTMYVAIESGTVRVSNVDLSCH